MNVQRLPLETPSPGLEPGFANLPAFLQPQAGGDLLADLSSAALSTGAQAIGFVNDAAGSVADWLPGDGEPRQ